MSAINVEEILEYKPVSKRGHQENEEEDVSSVKKAKNSSEPGSSRSFASLPEETLSLLSAGDQQNDNMDENGVKKMILNFEKKILKNQEMRIKFPDQPTKFMDSEEELNVAIQEMHAVATVPHLYQLLVQFKCVESLLQLLSHENSDISIAVVDLLQELTDVDTLVESEEGANILIDALLKNQVIELLVQNLERLDESSRLEADGVQNSLAVFENISDFRPEIGSTPVVAGLVTWILKRLKSKMPFDAVRLYCSEILAILETSEENRKLLGELDGVDILLQQLALYKRHNPSSVDEIEYMENLFDCLCAALLFPPNKIRFLEGEGLQLMNLMLREKKMSRGSALKVLNYATMGENGKDNCDKFVEILGLRTLFPLFMKTPSKSHRVNQSPEKHEEHVCAIIRSLLTSCSPPQRQRVLNKFVENNHEKVERLTELHFVYADKVRYFEKARQKRQQQRSVEESDEEAYLVKLDAGLFTLQLIDYILAEVVVTGAASIRERAAKVFNLKGESFDSVKRMLSEFVANIGDKDNPTAATAEINHVNELLSKL